MGARPVAISMLVVVYTYVCVHGNTVAAHIIIIVFARTLNAPRSVYVQYANYRLDAYVVLRLARDFGPSPAVDTRPVTKYADTDMELTPEWWISTRPVTLKRNGPPAERPSKAAPRTYADAMIQSTLPAAEIEADNGPFKVVEKRRRKSIQPPTVIPAAKRPPQKPPAVLVKVPAGGSYAETVKAVKGAVNPIELGVDIAAMRMTRDGHLLLEVRGGDAPASAEKLTGAVADKVGTRVGEVVKLSRRIVAEDGDAQRHFMPER